MKIVNNALLTIGNGHAKGEPTKPKAQEALDLARQGCKEFFIDQHGAPFAAIEVNGHIETIGLNNSRFRNWLCKLFYEERQSILSSEDVGNVLNILRSEAEFYGERRELQNRIAGDGKEVIYYDLTNRDWQVVKITPYGWSIENEPPILFVRYRNHSEQVTPVTPKDMAIFDKFLSLTNVKTEHDRLLLKCYVIASLIPGIPKPVLMLHGEQGGAKSTLQELIKMLIDPCSVRSLSFPRDVNELVQKLSHHYFADFDNVSHIKEWISDELCKAVTGSGFSKRQLYTDDEDVIYNIMRCVAFNGINLGASKADLLDRGLIIQLEGIPKENRRKVKVIWQEFQAIKPQLLGYIFDILANALRMQQEGEINLKEFPRMADFAEISEAISRSMDYPEGAFLAAYYHNVDLQTEEAIQANPVGQCILELMADRTEFTGSFALLLTELETKAQDLKIKTEKNDFWPKSPSALSRRLNEVMTTLRELGIIIERHTTKQNTRYVVICKMPPNALMAPDSRDHLQNTLDCVGGISGDIESQEVEPPEMPAGSEGRNQAQNPQSGAIEGIGDNLQ
jgi:hypothetical protein